MTRFTASADGTTIAYESLGDGPPLVLVGGMFCHRPQTRALAEALADSVTAVGYDRRGRGESGDTPPYAVAREVEDLAAVIDAIGGPIGLYGHSSGAALALEAAAAGLPITHLVLHEPPYDDDPEGRAASREMGRLIAAAVADDRRGDAIRLFLEPMGMPPDALAGAIADPGMLAVVPTMPYDFALVGDTDGAPFPEAQARAVPVPTLVLAGNQSAEFFRTTAERLATLIPDARLEVLSGAGHDAAAEVVAPAVIGFLQA